MSACAPAYLDQRKDEPQNAADAVRNADLTPRFPIAARQKDAASGGAGGFLAFGSPQSAPDPADGQGIEARGAASETADGFTLNFDATPVAAVVKAVLGDILGLRYNIDPRAQGAISLSSSRPIPKKDLLFVLESALRANNLGMVREAGGYRILPLGDAGAFGPGDRADSPDSASPGYGMTAIPLRNVSAGAISRLLEGFATRPGAIRADPSGRTILVVGTGPERAAAVDTVRQFDVDWMRGQSVGMVPVRNGSSAAVAGALDKIMDTGEAGLGHGLVKIQDIAAQNSVLIVAARPGLLQAAAKWVERLDSSSAASAGVHIYKVRYGDAKQLAGLLSSMFSAKGGEGDANQTAPGSGQKHLTVTERLTGGSGQSGAGASSSGFGAEGSQGQGLGSGAGTNGAQPFGGLQSAALNQAFADAGQGQGPSSSEIFNGTRIAADTANNAVLVYGSAESFAKIEKALQQIDRPKAQVAIDVTIAEVTLNDQLNYGVQYYIANHIDMASGGLTSTAPPLTGGAGGNVGQGFNVVIGHALTPHVILNALHQLTDVRVLSNPSLVVVDNQQATLEVGNQVPVSTGSATVLSSNNAVVNTVDYKNTGIILDVLPRVSPDNTVQLEINQEISDVVPQSATSSSSTETLTPTISQRKVKSEISVTSGQMVLLAGLVSETQSKSRDGVPGLDQLPLVGGAFGTTGKSRARTELIILIRPQVIHDSVDASRVAEQLRAKMRGGRIDAVSLPSALQVGAKPFP